MWRARGASAIIVARARLCIVARAPYIGSMGQRPDHVKPPAYLSKNTPVPTPAVDPLGRDPVRYGDWELKGIAIDF
jgi:hypothetical protein